METPLHSINSLFTQLGLPDDASGIDRFIATHQLPRSVPLAEAPFWTPAQAAFLSEEVGEDSDWAEVVEELNVRLHS